MLEKFIAANEVDLKDQEKAVLEYLVRHTERRERIAENLKIGNSTLHNRTLKLYDLFDVGGRLELQELYLCFVEDEANEMEVKQ